MINIAIVEDDEESINLIKNYILRFDNERKTECRAESFLSGLNFISEYKPIYDIVFMDIDMPYMDGLEASKKLREIDQNVVLIFVTNMAQYAIKGYEVSAIDFAVKPFEYSDFCIKMDKALAYISRKKCKKLFIGIDGVYKNISVNSIRYIEANGHFLDFHINDEVIRSRGKLSELEHSLESYGFFRCHKGYLVNLSYITEVGQNTVTVGNDKIIVARNRKKELLQAMAEYYGGVE